MKDVSMIMIHVVLIRKEQAQVVQSVVSLKKLLVSDSLSLTVFTKSVVVIVFAEKL